MKIVAIRGDITRVDVDAVVSPTDAPSPRRRRIVDRLVDRAGEEVKAEKTARGPLRVGEAMLTTGGRLRCRYVIHAPVGGPEATNDPRDVERSTLAALRCAAASGLRSVAIPAFPRSPSATRALIETVRRFDEGRLERVLIVAGKGRVVSALEKVIATEQ